MSWGAQFFTQRRLTSKLKHLVLQRYVKEFAYHLGSARPVLYYVDGFAGAGVYALGSIREDGSPLLIARLGQQIQSSSRPFHLRCLNVERNPKRFLSLERETAPFQPDIVEENYRAEFVDVMDDILRRIGDAPAFFFIDPFGTRGIAFEQLLPIFNRQHRTEVLITLQTDGIAKKAGWFGREDSPDARDRELARTFTQHLAAALDVEIGELRRGWRETGAQGNTSAFEERAVRHYMRRLRLRNRTRFHFAKPFKVNYYREDDPLLRTPVCFHLVFATQNETGLFKMNDAMVDALDEFYSEIYSGNLFPTFAREVEQKFGRAAVQKEIVRRTKPFTIDEVKRHCMQDTDYLIKGADYRKLILQLTKAEILRKISPGVASNDRTLFEVRNSDRSRQDG